jgi:hypothetical protein
VVSLLMLISLLQLIGLKYCVDVVSLPLRSPFPLPEPPVRANVIIIRTPQGLSSNIIMQSNNRQIFTGVSISHQISTKITFLKAADIRAYDGLDIDELLSLDIRAIKLMRIIMQIIVTLLRSKKRM